MKHLSINDFSETYSVRKLTEEDTDIVFQLCKENPQYYKYAGKELCAEMIRSDFTATPPDISLEQKYYVGFYDDETLVAVMDLIDGYPDADCAYIGFFMMNHAMQGKKIGSKIVKDVLAYLKTSGFTRCMLGIDKENPQSNHFWRKNGFKVIRELLQDEHAILVAELELNAE